MKRLIPIAFLLATFLTSNAQFENIDLSQYKLPDIKRHQLDFSFGYSSNFSKISYEDSPEVSLFGLNNNLNGNYSFYSNTNKVQMTGWGGIGSGLRLDWEKNDKSSFEKSDVYHYSFDTGIEKRIYFNEDDRLFLFWSPILVISTYYNYNKEVSNNDNISNKYLSRNLNFSPEIKVGGGIGRIEPVGDLRRAIYILEDLFENDRLNRLPDESEIIQLADRVAQLRNQRFFDSRLRRIYEIKSLDSLLNSMEIVDGMDATYFTSLTDMWDYGDESRFSGTRIQLNVFGKLFYDFNKIKNVHYLIDSEKVTNIDKEKFYNELVGTELLFYSYKPMGLKWQRYLSANISFNQYFIDQVSYPSSHEYNIIKSEITYQYDWFLNTRTSASFSVNGYYQKYDYAEEDDYYKDNNDFICTLDGNLYYYFSPRLKASVSLLLNYQWNDQLHTFYNKQFYFRNSIGISYSLF